MNQPLTNDEKWLIERELVAREKENERRRNFRRRVFGVGMIAGFAASALTMVFGGFFIPLIPKLTWIACILVYMDADCLLPAFSKHISLSWHTNPWKESLSRLSDTGDILRGITLLACYKVSHLFYLFVIHVMQ